jgi:hypothetical protein
MPRTAYEDAMDEVSESPRSRKNHRPRSLSGEQVGNVECAISGLDPDRIEPSCPCRVAAERIYPSPMRTWVSCGRSAPGA